MKMLEVSQLRKKYPQFALGSIDLELEAGSMNGLIGPNASGKSTLYRCIIGTVRRDYGRIRVAGVDADERSGHWRNAIGYIGDYTPLFDHLTGAANLALFAGFYENWSAQLAESLAAKLDLDLTLKARSYSTGQRAKLAVVLALAHRPKLLLLDEPATGLDPVARSTFLETLYELMQNEAFTLLYATHHVAEIERLADHLIFLDHGKVLKHAEKEDLVANWRRLTFRAANGPKAIPGQVTLRQDGQDYEVVSSSANDAIDFLHQSEAFDIQVSRLPLEEICVDILKTEKAMRA
jgi:ABC-2 type transport system ATP-binding protein